MIQLLKPMFIFLDTCFNSKHNYSHSKPFYLVSLILNIYVSYCIQLTLGPNSSSPMPEQSTHPLAADGRGQNTEGNTAFPITKFLESGPRRPIRANIQL